MCGWGGGTNVRPPFVVIPKYQGKGAWLVGRTDGGDHAKSWTLLYFSSYVRLTHFLLVWAGRATKGEFTCADSANSLA
jgi:hypothetical protein